MIIGLIGLKGSGKTTAANFLAKKLDAVQLSFAAKLKETCSEVFNIPMDNFENRMAKEDIHADKYILASHILKIFEAYGIDGSSTKLMPMAGTRYNSNRELLQIVGTDILRSYDSAIHTNSIGFVAGKINIVTDVRFYNEAEFLDKKEAFLLYINSDKAAQSLTSNSHESEKQVMGVASKYATHIITNNQESMQEFEDSLMDFVSEVSIFTKL